MDGAGGGGGVRGRVLPRLPPFLVSYWVGGGREAAAAWLRPPLKWSMFRPEVGSSQVGEHNTFNTQNEVKTYLTCKKKINK